MVKSLTAAIKSTDQVYLGFSLVSAASFATWLGLNLLLQIFVPVGLFQTLVTARGAKKIRNLKATTPFFASDVSDCHFSRFEDLPY